MARSSAYIPRRFRVIEMAKPPIGIAVDRNGAIYEASTIRRTSRNTSRIESEGSYAQIHFGILWRLASHWPRFPHTSTMGGCASARGGSNPLPVLGPRFHPSRVLI